MMEQHHHKNHAISKLLKHDLNSSQDNTGVLLLVAEVLCKLLVQAVHNFSASSREGIQQ